MTPQALAGMLMEELELAIEDDPRLEGWRCAQVLPPEDLAPDQAFVLELHRGEQRQIERLSAGQVAAYFADEEAAVDTWKRWLDELAQG